MHLKLVSVDFHTLELVNFVPETEKSELKLKIFECLQIASWNNKTLTLNILLSFCCWRRPCWTWMSVTWFWWTLRRQIWHFGWHTHWWRRESWWSWSMLWWNTWWPVMWEDTRARWTTRYWRMKSCRLACMLTWSSRKKWRKSCWRKILVWWHLRRMCRWDGTPATWQHAVTGNEFRCSRNKHWG